MARVVSNLSTTHQYDTPSKPKQKTAATPLPPIPWARFKATIPPGRYRMSRLGSKALEGYDDRVFEIEHGKGDWAGYIFVNDPNAPMVEVTNNYGGMRMERQRLPMRMQISILFQIANDWERYFDGELR